MTIKDNKLKTNDHSILSKLYNKNKLSYFLSNILKMIYINFKLPIDNNTK
jgi:hypothetical protein